MTKLEHDYGPRASRPTVLQEARMWPVPMLLADTASPVDPNWLLSTTAQSAAALVAIVGGFLVSRLVTLSSEQEGLRRRAREVQGRRGVLAEQYEEVHASRIAVSRRFFRESQRDDVIARRGSLDPSELVADNIMRGSNVDETQAFAEELVADVQAAYTELDRAFPQSASRYPPGDPADLREAGVDVPESLEDIYTRVARAISDERRPPRFRVPDIGFVPSSDLRYVRQDALITQEQELASRLNELDVDAALLDDGIGRLSRPRNLRFGLGVLVYFSLVGVVLPLTLMSMRPIREGPTTRAIVLVGFFSGLLALLTYIVRAIRDLDRLVT